MSIFLEPYRKYAVFRGRASRKEFWSFYLFFIVGVCTLSFVGEIAGLKAYTPLPAIFYVLSALPFLAVNARRLQDTEINGWWMLPAMGLTGAALMSVVVYAVDDLMYGAGSPGILLWSLWVAVIIMNCAWSVRLFLPGTIGSNKFGPDPREAKKPLNSQ